MHTSNSRTRVKVFCKSRGEETTINLSLEYNDHADDKRKLRKAVMRELDVKQLSALKGTVQNIQLLKGKQP